jgi:hypothetical protein
MKNIKNIDMDKLPFELLHEISVICGDILPIINRIFFFNQLKNIENIVRISDMVSKSLYEKH